MDHRIVSSVPTGRFGRLWACIPFTGRHPGKDCTGIYLKTALVRCTYSQAPPPPPAAPPLSPPSLPAHFHWRRHRRLHSRGVGVDRPGRGHAPTTVTALVTFSCVPPALLPAPPATVTAVATTTAKPTNGVPTDVRWGSSPLGPLPAPDHQHKVAALNAVTAFLTLASDADDGGGGGVPGSAAGHPRRRRVGPDGAGGSGAGIVLGRRRPRVARPPRRRADLPGLPGRRRRPHGGDDRFARNSPSGRPSGVSWASHPPRPPPLSSPLLPQPQWCPRA